MSYTIPLAFSGLAIGLSIALFLALWTTRFAGSWVDRSAVALAALGTAIPSYWLGLLLILLFAVDLGWLPARAHAPLRI